MEHGMSGQGLICQDLLRFIMPVAVTLAVIAVVLAIVAIIITIALIG
jgi:hypothetical protein